MITPEQLAASGSEDSAQTALFCWSALPEVRSRYPELKWLAAIPNGGFRNKREASRLKAGGVKRGVPDLVLPLRNLMYAGLWLELKRIARPGKVQGKTSSEQDEWLRWLNSQGYAAMVAYGWEEARNDILWYLEVKR